MRAKQVIAILLLPVVLLSGPFSYWRRHYAPHAADLHDLESLAAYLHLVTVNNSGRLPSDLYSAEHLAALGQALLEGTGTNVEHRFYYVNWNGVAPANQLPNLPIVYDRHYRPDDPRGIGIIFGDGHVAWDPEANWLAQFAATNGLKQLALPQ